MDDADRSARWATSARMWLDMKTVTPRSAASARSSSRTSTMPAGSSALAGSSSTSSSGECSSARASESRCLLPSESCPARRSAYGSRRSSAIDAGDRSRWRAGQAALDLEVLAHGEVGVGGRPLDQEADAREHLVSPGTIRRPRTSTSPPLGRMSPSSMRIVVVLPAPLRQETVDLAAAHVEVERVDGEDVAVALAEGTGGNRGVRHRSPSWPHPATAPETFTVRDEQCGGSSGTPCQRRMREWRAVRAVVLPGPSSANTAGGPGRVHASGPPSEPLRMEHP